MAPSDTNNATSKVKSKDLSYDAPLPPFLQRLKSQHTGSSGDDPDRHERPVARNKGVKIADEDDGPTVVDESGEMVSREAYAEMENRGREDAEPGPEEEGGNVIKRSASGVEPVVSGAIVDGGDGGEEKRKGETRAGEGPGRKRKVGKVVGEDEGEVADRKTEVNLGQGEGEESGVKKALKKGKKKAKVKLAFDEEEGGEGT